MAEHALPRYVVTHFDQTEGVPCPCGTAQRALGGPDSPLLSVHRVRIRADSHLHYHKTLTETYVVLEGAGRMQLDDQAVELRPGSIVHIHPGTRHRAVGNLVVLNIVVPPFDPADEHHD